jgi:hypothetical protein
MFIFKDRVLAWVLRFLHFEVLRRNNDAVCRSLVACVEYGNIANYEIPNVDLLHGTLLASDDNNFFIATQTLKSNELAVFHPVINAGY